jgi:predicted nucleic acid-binding protein
VPSTAYIETSVIGYLTMRPSHDLVTAAAQAITRDWWETRRAAFDLVASEVVRQEIAAGDPSASKDRLEILAGLRLLDVTEEAGLLADRLLSEGPLPSRAQYDALHIAVSAIHGVDYLLTWNCKHIANAAMRPSIERLCRLAGYEPPIMCTPQELLDV